MLSDGLRYIYSSLTIFERLFIITGVNFSKHAADEGLLHCFVELKL